MSCRFHHGHTGEVCVCDVLGRAQRLEQVGGSHAIMKLRRSSSNTDGSLEIFKRSVTGSCVPDRAGLGFRGKRRNHPPPNTTTLG